MKSQKELHQPMTHFNHRSVNPTSTVSPSSVTQTSDRNQSAHYSQAARHRLPGAIAMLASNLRVIVAILSAMALMVVAAGAASAETSPCVAANTNQIVCIIRSDGS